MSLPAGVTTGLVTGTFNTLVAGASVPVDGMLVVFTPSSPVVLDAGATQTLGITAVTGVVRQGILYDASGAVGVTLIATDSAGINPTGFTWLVQFQGPVPLGLNSFSFALPGGTTKDLATISPVPPVPGVPSMVATDAVVAGYATGPGLTHTYLDGRYQTQGGLDAAQAGNVSTPGSSTDIALKSRYASQYTATGVGDETAAINSWLAASSPLEVKRLVGNPTISAPLVLKSKTYLDATSATVTLGNGSGCNMIQNAAYATPVLTISDAATTAGSAVVTSASGRFTSGMVGNSLSVVGAGPQGGLYWGTIKTFNSATSVTLSVNAVSTVSGAAGTVSGRDSNISIVGGTWDGNMANQTSPTVLGAMGLVMSHIDGLTLSGITFKNTSKEAFYVSDWTNVAATTLTFSQTSGGLQLDGPGVSASVRGLYGTTNDDMFALIGTEWTNVRTAYGNITGVTATGIYPNASERAVRLGGGVGSVLRGIHIDGIYGSTTNSAVTAQDDQTGPMDIGGLTISNVRCTILNGTSSYGVINLSPSLGRDIEVENITHDALGSTLVVPAVVYVGSNFDGNGEVGSIEALTVRGVKFDGAPASQTSMVMVDAGAHHTNVTIGRLVMEDCQAREGGTINGVTLNGVASGQTASVTELFMSGGYTNNWAINHTSVTAFTAQVLTRVHMQDWVHTAGGGLVNLLNTNPATVLVDVVNCDHTGGSCAFQLATAAELRIDNLVTAPSSGIIRATGASGLILVDGRGVKNTTANPGVVITSGMTVQSRALGFPVDVALLSKNAGDMAYNTNAATLPGVGPAFCDGTTWRNANAVQKTGTATLAAGTVTVADTSITANSVIRVAQKTAGGTPGALFVSAKVAATSFTITSTNAADTSVVQYDIITY